MLKQTCDMLLAQAEVKRREAIAAVEAEYQQVLDAVRLLRSFSESASDRLGHGELSTAVLAAIDQLEGPFTVRDVEAELQVVAPEVAERVSIASISTTLRRLIGKGIGLAEPGYGTRPARYFKELRNYCGGGPMGPCREPAANRSEEAESLPV